MCLDNIRWHLDKARGNARHAVTKIMAEHAARGTLQSSMTTMRIFHEVRQEFDAGIEVALGEVRRTVNKTKLDRDELRQATIQCLTNFAIAMKSVTEAGRFPFLPVEGMDQNLRAFDEHLKFKLRQFDVGFFVPPEPEVPQVANSINIGNMVGSAIAQGSPGATQSVEFRLKVDMTSVALEAFEAAIRDAKLPENVMTDLTADVQTIRAQLSKASPSVPIIREAGKSLRTVVESVAGNLLTPFVQDAASALWAAIGLG